MVEFLPALMIWNHSHLCPYVHWQIPPLERGTANRRPLPRSALLALPGKIQKGLLWARKKTNVFPHGLYGLKQYCFFAFHLQALSHGIMMLTAWIWINPLDQENQSKLQRTKKNKKNTVCGLLGSRNVQTSLENMVFLSFVFLWFVLVSLGLFDSVGLIQIYPNHMI